MFELDYITTIDLLWGYLFGASVVVAITFIVFGYFRKFLDRILP